MTAPLLEWRNDSVASAPRNNFRALKSQGESEATSIKLPPSKKMFLRDVPKSSTSRTPSKVPRTILILCVLPLKERKSNVCRPLCNSSPNLSRERTSYPFVFPGRFLEPASFEKIVRRIKVTKFCLTSDEFTGYWPSRLAFLKRSQFDRRQKQ